MNKRDAKTLRHEITQAKKDHAGFLSGNVESIEKQYHSFWKSDAYLRTFLGLDTPADAKVSLKVTTNDYFGKHQSVSTFFQG